MKYKTRVLLALGLVIATGITSRLVPLGFKLWDKYVGDILYASAFYLGLSLLWPSGRIKTKTLLIAMYVVAIELFQLTPIPGQLNQSDNLIIRTFAYLVLGSNFSGWDILAYGVGIAGVVFIDRWYLGRDQQQHSTQT